MRNRLKQMIKKTIVGTFLVVMLCATIGGATLGIPDSIVKLTYSNPTKTADWIEYSFSVKNNTSEPISGINVLIPTSSSVSDIQCWGNWAAAYDESSHGVVAYLSKTLQPGESLNGTSDDKFGMNISGKTVYEPYVLEINCKKPVSGADGSELKYELTGKTKTIPFAQTPVGKHGKLSVKTVSGYEAPVIVDEHGNPFQLRGSSTHGIQWEVGYNYINEGAFQSLRDEWGVNLIRLACYVTQDGYTMGSASAMDTRIKDAVSIAEKLGLYVLIDWHVHEIGDYANPHDTKTAATKFFDTYSKLYKDTPNVLFEICNEPVGVDWYTDGKTDLYAYCNDITKLIRANGSDNLVICGTNTWSQRVDQVATKPLTYENVLYTLHFYAAQASHKENLRTTLKKGIQNKTPVFVTEFGICSADGNGSIDIDSANTWIQLLDENNISYCCWQVSNLGEASSYLETSCKKTTGGWVAEDLATTGVWLVNTYREHQQKEEEAEAGASPSPSVSPTATPTATPSATPTATPTAEPTAAPSESPSASASETPSESPSMSASESPSMSPSETPSEIPSVSPSVNPSVTSSTAPSASPNTGSTQVPITDTLSISSSVKGAGKVAVANMYQLAIRKNMKLKVSVASTNTSISGITYASSNTKVATISSSGKIKAKKAGKTTISVITAEGTQKTFTLKVMKSAVKKVTVTGVTKLKVKKSAKLKVKMTPSKKISKKVIFKSSNKKIATVSQKGIVKAKKKGNVKITAYATDGSGKKGSIRIKCY